MDYKNVVNNEALLQAIDQMRQQNTPENQSNMLDLMVEAKLLAPVSITPAPETNGEMMSNVMLPPDAKIQFHMIENGNGQRFFLAFTSFEEMIKWRRDMTVQTIVVSFDDYASMLKNTVDDNRVGGFVIDPFGINQVFLKEQAIAIKEVKDRRNGASGTHTIQAGEEVYFGEPMNYPTEMVEAVKEYLSGAEGVSGAYLQLLRQKDEESYLIVLDYDGDRQTLFEGVATAAKPYLNDMCLDILGTENELGQKIYNRAKPFWEK